MVKVLHGNTFELIQDFGSDLWDVAFVDPPFNYTHGGNDRHSQEYQDMIRETAGAAGRVVKHGGFIIHVNYMEAQMVFGSELQKSCTFHLVNHIVCAKNVALQEKGNLPHAATYIFIYSKGLRQSLNVPLYMNGLIKNPNSETIVSNIWGYKECERFFQPGYKGIVPEAMPRWYINRLLKLVPCNKLLDMFSGAGNVLLECMDMQIDAIGFELSSERYDLIQKRIKRKREEINERTPQLTNMV